MTTQPSTGPRPRTEAGREYADRLALTLERARPHITVDIPSEVEIADGINAAMRRIEAEARAAALTAVEEAVRDIARVADHPSIEDGPAFARGARSVLAVLAKLQEDEQ